jgi:microcystin-dependent protein
MDKWTILLYLLIAMLTFVVTILFLRSEKRIETIRYIEHAKDSVVGDLKYSTHTADFHGWLLCDGRSLSRETYSDLFKIIGTTFGSANSTSFNLPDARGRVLGLSGQGSGLSLRHMGDKVGEEVHTLTLAELVTHHHNGTIQANGLHRHTGTVDSAGLHSHTGTVDSAGSHAHTVNDPGHTHTQTTINDDFNNSGGGPGPSFSKDSAGSITWNNINGSATGISLNTNGSHVHSFTSLDSGAHVHTFTSADNGSHAHSMTISDTGSSTPFNVMQPTLFIGNLFIFAGVEFSDHHEHETPSPTTAPPQSVRYQSIEGMGRHPTTPLHMAPLLPSSAIPLMLQSGAYDATTPNQGIAIHSNILP